MKKIILISALLFSFNTYGAKPTQSPVTEFIEQYGIEGKFTIIQGKTKFKALVGEMENGKRVGEWTYYYPQSEQIWSVERYAKGEPVGVWLLYHPDGRIKMRDDLNDMNDSYNRPTPRCMGMAKGFHSTACTGAIKGNAARGN